MNTVDRWSVRIFIGQHEDFTTAEARLTTRDTTRLRGSGTQHRDPAATQAAEIGEEVAVGRALIDLGHRLLATAAGDAEAMAAEYPSLHPDPGGPA